MILLYILSSKIVDPIARGTNQLPPSRLSKRGTNKLSFHAITVLWWARCGTSLRSTAAATSTPSAGIWSDSWRRSSATGSPSKRESRCDNCCSTASAHESPEWGAPAPTPCSRRTSTSWYVWPGRALLKAVTSRGMHSLSGNADNEAAKRSSLTDVVSL